MSRIRANFVTGAIDNAPLSDVGTTLTSDELSLLPVVVAPDIAVLVLDPTKTAGEPEIVYVTAHTAGATTATITRGQESTVARAHNAGVRWIHTVTAQDLGMVGATRAHFMDMGTSNVGLSFYDTDVVGTHRGSGLRHYVKNSNNAEVSVASVAFSSSDKVAGAEDGSVGFYSMRDGVIGLGLAIERQRVVVYSDFRSAVSSGNMWQFRANDDTFLGLLGANGAFRFGSDVTLSDASHPNFRWERANMRLFINRQGTDLFTGVGGAASGPWTLAAFGMQQNARNTSNGPFIEYHDTNDSSSIFRVNRDGGINQQYINNYPAVAGTYWTVRNTNARNNGNAVEHREGFYRSTSDNNHGSLKYEMGRLVDGTWYGKIEFKHQELEVVGAHLKISDTNNLLSLKMRAQQAEITTQENTASTSYTTLPTNSPQISIASPPSGRVVVAVSFEGYNSGGSQAYMTVRLWNTGNSTYINTASDTDAAVVGGVTTWSRGFRVTVFDVSSVGVGTNINIDTWFKSANGSTCYFQHRRVIAWASP